jgi:hypothetical protein
VRTGDPVPSELAIAARDQCAMSIVMWRSPTERVFLLLCEALYDSMNADSDLHRILSARNEHRGYW